MSLTQVKPITIEDLTTREVDGAGVYDALLSTAMAHFEKQYNNSTFDKTDVGVLFSTLMESTLAQSVEFLLRRDKTSLDNELTVRQIALADRDIKLKDTMQKQAEQEVVLNDLRIANQTTQNALIKVQLSTAKHQDAIAAEGVTHAKQTTELNGVAIKEAKQRLVLNEKEIELRGVQIEIARAELTLRLRELKLREMEIELRKVEIELRKAEMEMRKLEMDLKREEMRLRREEHKVNLEIAKANLEIRREELALQKERLTLEKDKLIVETKVAEANLELIKQRVITEVAQTNDNYQGKPITGIAGAQTALYKQQKESFIRDSEQKLAKIWADVYIARKSVDEGTETPDALDKEATTKVLQHAATGGGVGDL